MTLLTIYHFSYFDLFPYLVFTGLLWMVAISKQKEKGKIILMTIIVLLFSCLRYDIGYDYAGYKEIAQGLNLDEYNREELFDRWIMDLSQTFNNYQLFFIISSFIIYIPLAWICYKKSCDPILSLVIYLCYPLFFVESMSAVRNFMAYSVVFVGIEMLMEHKPLKFLVTIVIGMGFHLSAAFALLLLPIYKIRTGNKAMWIAWIISFLASAFLKNYLQNISSDNMLIALFLKSVASEEEGGGMFTILVNIICFFVLINWNSLKRIRKENESLMQVLVFGVLIWNLLSFDFVTRSRLSLYFLMSMLIIIPEFTKIKFSRSLPTRSFIIIFFIGVALSSFIINIKGNLKDNTKPSFLPYQTILSGVDYERN